MARFRDRTQTARQGIAEQNFSNSDRADPNSAAKIARILGVDAIIIGSITQFGRDDKSTNVGGGAASSALGRFGIGGVKTSKSTAVCTITARMIDTSTAEILASIQGHGEETRNGTGIVGTGGSYAGMAGGALDMKSSNFANTILGAAVNKATTDVAHGLDQKAASLPTAPVKAVKIDGVVADVSRWHPHHQCRLQGRRQSRRHAGRQSQGARGEGPHQRQSAPQRGRCRGHPQDH
jgi:curli biogenesis system outer membrane secretion channel CsgG